MLWVVLAIGGSLAAGVMAERRHGAHAGAAARRILKLLLYGVTPPVAFVNIVHLEITPDVGGGVLLGWVALILAGAIAWFVGRHWLRLPDPSTGVLVNVSLQANTGYLGLPLTVALLGAEHLPEAVAYDAFVQAPVLLLGVFGVAAALGTEAGGTRRERARAFISRNPPLLAVLAGLVAPAALAPAALVDASHLVVFAALPFAFFAAGAIIAEERTGSVRRPRLTPPIGAVLVLRLVLAPLLLLALAAPLIDLPPAYLLLAAMPAGINGLTVAHAFGLDLRFAAASIAWTTGVGVTVATALTLAV